MVPSDDPYVANGSTGLRLDEDGHLARAEDWTPAIAMALARREGLQLREEHWTIVGLLRAYWMQHLTAPPLRVLVVLASQALGPDRGCARNLHRLFPKGPARQGCRCAGLPKPDGCL
jgi:tRNA 2-thiouridine synthesizing protein E